MNDTVSGSVSGLVVPGFFLRIAGQPGEAFVDPENETIGIRQDDRVVGPRHDERQDLGTGGGVGARRKRSLG